MSKGRGSSGSRGQDGSKAGPASMGMGGWRRWRRPARDIAVIAALLAGLSFLPPDTSFAERQKQGVLRFCVPDRDNALIRADDAGRPGPELRLMEGVAARLGLKLQLVEVANMGRSFNPRDWQIGRGQCDLLGGGLADSPANRGFLTLLPNGGRIALVRIGGDETPPPAGSEIGVFMGSAGLDRLRLSRFMREAGWHAEPLSSPSALAAWLATGRPAIASSLTSFAQDVQSHDLPEQAGESHALAFGLWRGDVTLTRRVRAALQREMEREQLVAGANDLGASPLKNDN